MITANSRYRKAVLTQVVSPSGDTRREIRVRPPKRRLVNFTYHRVESDDERVDIIARNYYGDARAWWTIADANPDVLDWYTLTPGLILRIPSV